MKRSSIQSDSLYVSFLAWLLWRNSINPWSQTAWSVRLSAFNLYVFVAWYRRPKQLDNEKRQGIQFPEHSFLFELIGNEECNYKNYITSISHFLVHGDTFVRPVRPSDYQLVHPWAHNAFSLKLEKKVSWGISCCVTSSSLKSFQKNGNFEFLQLRTNRAGSLLIFVVCVGIGPEQIHRSRVIH